GSMQGNDEAVDWAVAWLPEGGDFFFSSRRRHTRFSRDWSSDVCSFRSFDRPVADLLLDVRTASGQQRYQVSLLTQAGPGSLAARSEERRVGKECRSRRWAAQQQKKRRERRRREWQPPTAQRRWEIMRRP